MKNNALTTPSKGSKMFGFGPLWACNQKCSFCAKGSPPPGVKPSLSTAEALAVLRNARRDGYDSLSIDGGEPTLRSDLPRLLSAAAKMGYATLAITTNAVALADGKIVGEFFRRPELWRQVGFCVSLHSHLAGVSEKLTRAPGSFKKTLSGIREIIRAGFDFSLYHVITTLNYRKMPRYAAFIAKTFPRANTVTFSYMFPAKHLGAEALDLYPKVSLTAPYLKKAAGILEAAGIPVVLGSCGVVPLCLMRGTERLFLKTSKTAGEEFLSFDTAKMAPFPFFDSAFNHRNRVKGPACAKCFINRACDGVWNFYADRFGFSELRPFTGEYFRRLPRGAGKAALNLAGCSKAPSPETLAMINIIDLRYRGFSVLRLVNKDSLPGAAGRLAAFAGKAGFDIVSRTAAK